MQFETVIGMEIHAELLTKSKIFCGCENVFGGADNTHCCPVCMGLPGTLPVLNQTVVDYAIKAGLATNCEIALDSRMDRKNYHYPDLPKGYQISQREFPLCRKGHVDIDVDGVPARVGITEIHIEEDAGKLVHMASGQYSRADYNRAGVPLIEIVSEPDMRSAEQARAFLETIRNTLMCIGVSDCKMQEGSMRCDVNISIRPMGTTELTTRCEIKNMNSFRSVARAIEAEVKRQQKIVLAGGTIVQQTMRFDDETGLTYPMRSKEDSQDYRYFPEPDLMPILVEAAHVEELRASLPELPDARRKRYAQVYGLPERECVMISGSNALSTLFDDAVAAGASARSAANWMVGNLASLLKEKEMDAADLAFDGKQLAALIAIVENGTINSGAGKQVLSVMMETGKQPTDIANELSLVQVSDKGELATLAQEIIDENPKAVADYLAGKDKAITFLCGNAMKRTRGKANPQLMRELFIEILSKLQ